MFGKICYILLTLGTLPYSQSSYIQKDSTKNPFVYYQDGEIEFEISNVEYSYQIDLSFILELRVIYRILRPLCQETEHFRQLTNSLYYDLPKWNKISNKKFPTKNLISWEPLAIEGLKNLTDLVKGRKNTQRNCNDMIRISEKLIGLNDDFNNFSKSIFSGISNIVPFKPLLTHSYNYTKNTNLTSALDFTHWFEHNFHKFTKFDFKVSKNNAFLTITIPLYTHAILAKIYTKPIIHNKIPYISNTKSKFAIESQMGNNYFEKIEDNCFYANNKTFCNQPSKSNECDDQYISRSSNIFNKKCFTKLPFQNIVTQIRNDIYFLAIYPISIDIICNGSHQTVLMHQSSKIINNECFINSTFFTFDTNPTQEHILYFSNQTTLSNTPNLLIQFYGISAFLFLYTIFINIAIYYYYKANTQNNTWLELDSVV